MKDKPKIETKKVTCSVCNCLVSAKGMKKHEQTKKHKTKRQPEDAYKELADEILKKNKELKNMELDI